MPQRQGQTARVFVSSFGHSAFGFHSDFGFRISDFPKVISLIVPIFNEQENLPAFRQRATAALESTGESWEIIFVNDGSKDRSAQMLQEFHQQDPRLKVIELSRNFGPQPA